MNLINLTPHPITIRSLEGDITIPTSGTIARVSVTPTLTGETVLGVPVFRNTYGQVTGLIENQAGVCLPCIVSGMVLSALPKGTLNVFAPDTGATAVRDEKGHIVAVTQLLAA